MEQDLQAKTAAAALRRRNLLTGLVLGGVALFFAVSVWYSKLG